MISTSSVLRVRLPQALFFGKKDTFIFFEAHFAKKILNIVFYSKMTKYYRYLANDGGDGDDGGGRISGRVQAPIPSHPGIKYPVRAPPHHSDMTILGELVIE